MTAAAQREKYGMSRAMLILHIHQLKNADGVYFTTFGSQVVSAGR